MIDMVVRNMSCDPMAAAVDWLDAYRAGDIEAILAMYAEDAVVHCDCDGMKTLTGPEALRAYWVDRLRRHPASALDNLQPSGDGTEISYGDRLGKRHSGLRPRREDQDTQLRSVKLRRSMSLIAPGRELCYRTG